MESPPFVLVSGCMRSGTTLTSGWLGTALGPAHLGLRESGIPNFAHSMRSVFDFHQRDHAFAYGYPEGTPERARMLARMRDLLVGMYADKGWRPGAWILDKAPYALSDGARFYDGMAELFPSLRLIHLVRDPYEVVASMRARTWGRGPFPRDPHISPLPFHLESELENRIGDLPADSAERPLEAPRKRSIELCCLHYNLALRGFCESTASAAALVLDYDHLVHREAVRRAVAAFLGCEIRERYAFERRARAALDPADRARIDALLWPETIERRRQLAARSERALRPHRQTAGRKSEGAPAPGA